MCLVCVQCNACVDVFVPYLKSRTDFDWKNTVIVSPDAGGVGRARRIADKLGGIPVVTILKVPRITLLKLILIAPRRGERNRHNGSYRPR